MMGWTPNGTMDRTSTQGGEHLACPRCNYDLFGLPCDAEVVRCPECGRRSHLRLLRMSVRDRKKRVRGMESLPAICALLFWAAAGCGVLLAAYPSAGSAALALGFVVGWMGATIAFFRRYRFVLGATQVVVLHHVCALCFWFGTLTTWMACGVVLGRPPRAGVAGLILLLAVWGTLALGAWLYKRARGILGNMHDQLATPDRGPEKWSEAM